MQAWLLQSVMLANLARTREALGTCQGSELGPGGSVAVVYLLNFAGLPCQKR